MIYVGLLVIYKNALEKADFSVYTPAASHLYLSFICFFKLLLYWFDGLQIRWNTSLSRKAVEYFIVSLCFLFFYLYNTIWYSKQYLLLEWIPSNVRSKKRSRFFLKTEMKEVYFSKEEIEALPVHSVKDFIDLDDLALHSSFSSYPCHYLYSFFILLFYLIETTCVPWAR